MKALVDRLIQAGHFEEVWTAGVYAGFRGVAVFHNVRGVAFKPIGHETDELFLLVDKMEPAELRETATYIKAELGEDGYYDDEEDDFVFDDVAA
ncbi:hypothetical protein [Lacipirellula parvula]|uniref:Uncharacterized protein n=1 Tax=Lacipirellula parvula TaxID=2650471 RepID=A0A5K7XMK6_9BACT|nr:hypothetical protein [Lacipirellula parvula]BBO34299.1 hypothetical protein PLANPX_3911 [Lacipirellula parvula]